MNPSYSYCDCESNNCVCASFAEKRYCDQVENLADYAIASFKQTLCPMCANSAFNYATLYGRERFVVLPL